MASPDLWRELERTRDRVHEQGASIAGSLHRVIVLEAWRHEHQREADEAMATLANLVSDDSTRKAVQLALSKRSKLELSWFQRSAAVFLAIPALYDTVRLLGG